MQFTELNSRNDSYIAAIWCCVLVSITVNREMDLELSDNFNELLNYVDVDELMVDVLEEVDDKRFGVTSEEELNYLTSKQFCENTSKKIVSVMKLFKFWVQDKNKKLRLSTSSVPTKSLEEWTVDELNTWLPVFINEARKANGDYYRAKTLMEYIIMLQCHLHAHGCGHRFLSDLIFQPIKNCLDNVMKDLQKRGLG